jgi:hypothetical protein
MDTALKHHFVEFRAFVVETLAGVEKRLTTRLDVVEKRLDGIDAKLDILISRVPRRPRVVRKRRQRRR